MEEAVGMIAHNEAYVKEPEDDLFMDSIDKNDTIEQNNALGTVD